MPGDSRRSSDPTPPDSALSAPSNLQRMKTQSKKPKVGTTRSTVDVFAVPAKSSRPGSAAQYEQTERERQQRHLDRLDRRQQQQLERLGGRR